MRVLAACLVMALSWPASAQDRAKYDEHVRKGQTFYELAEYPSAIAEYKAAYAIQQEPKLLYNIAQAYRLGNDCAMAQRFYKTFVIKIGDARLTGEEAQRKAHAEQQVTALDACAREQVSRDPGSVTAVPGETGTTPPAPVEKKPPPDETRPEPTPIRQPPPVEPIAPPVPSTEPPPAPGRALRITGYVGVAAGAAAIGASLWFWKQASDKESDLEERFAMGGVWDPPAMELDSDMRSASRNAKIFFGVGTGLAVTGGVLLYLGIRKADAAPDLAVAPLPGGGALSVSGRF